MTVSSEETPPTINDGSFNANPPGIGFWALVAEDFRTHGSDLASQGFWALFWHRFGNWRMSVGPRLLRLPLSALYRVMLRLGERSGGILLPYTVIVGRRVKLEHFGGMVLSAHRIGDDTIIRQNTTFGIARVAEPDARPVIGSGVDVGVGVAILGAVHVGDGAVIGANALVIRDVAPGDTVGGVPARSLRRGADG
ncbi:MAG: transferase [Pseudomonadota bacterium]